MAGNRMLILSPAAGLRETVPQALESVKGSLICKYWEYTPRGVYRNYRRA